MKNKLIIIGKNSYIGGYLTKYMETNSNDVISLSSKNCNFLEEGSVETFFNNLSNKFHYSIIFLATINRLVDNSLSSYMQNITLSKNLIKACKLTNIQSLIYFSSVDVYGREPQLPITENSQIQPDTWYGLAKYSSEWMLTSSGEISCPVTILRIPGIYGSAANDRSVIKKIASSIKTEQRVYIKGSGQSIRDYVYLKDLYQLIKLLIPLKYNGIINVATGHSCAIIEIANLVGRIAQIEFETVYESAEAEREFDLIFNTHTLTNLVPNFRFTTLEEGIRSYFQEYSQN